MASSSSSFLKSFTQLSHSESRRVRCRSQHFESNISICGLRLGAGGLSGTTIGFGAGGGAGGGVGSGSAFSNFANSVWKDGR